MSDSLAGSAPTNTDAEDLPKSQWASMILARHPEVLEVVERSRPLSGANSFGRSFASSHTQNRHVLTHENVMMLICNFLESRNLHQSVEKLKEETGFDFTQSTDNDSMLRGLAEVAIDNIESVFDPALVEQDTEGQEDVEVPVFDYLKPTMTFETEQTEKETPIWDEPQYPDGTPPPGLHLEKTGETMMVVSGTINRIIEFLTSKTASDLNARSVFLATHRSFCTSDMLLKKLLERANVPPNVLSDADTKQVRLFTVLVMKSWIEQHPGDFSEAMLEKVREFVEVTLPACNSANLAKKLRDALNRMGDRSNQADASALETAPEPIVPSNIFSAHLELSDVSCEEIARQLTLMDHQLYSSIPFDELLLLRQSVETRASKLASAINRGNMLIKWIASQVLRETTYKGRAAVISRWIEISQHLLGMNAFNTATTVYYGLTHGAVYRLSHTFSALSADARRTLKQMGTLASPSNCYNAYRENYTQSKPPCVPFLAAHAQELAFLQETLPDKVHGNEVNFHKRRLINSAIQDMIKYQSILYPYLPIFQVQRFLRNFDVLENQEAMYKQSFVLEPKGISAVDLVKHEAQLSLSKSK